MPCSRGIGTEPAGFRPDSSAKGTTGGPIFPLDFGFIPGTIGEDGDPLDAIVISEVKMFPGCLVKCRIVGAIQAKQTELNGQTGAAPAG